MSKGNGNFAGKKKPIGIKCSTCEHRDKETDTCKVNNECYKTDFSTDCPAYIINEKLVMF